MTAGELLTHYFRLRQRWYRKEPPKMWRNASFDAADRYLERCKKEGLDPVDFLDWRLRWASMGGSPHAPALKRLVGPKSLRTYREMGCGIVKTARNHEELTRAADDTARHLELIRGVHHMHESMRQTHRGSPLLCMVERELSGGYHPFSAVCPFCPLAHRCAEATNADYGWDVVAFRAGEPVATPSVHSA